jgi:hypothetical protein
MTIQVSDRPLEGQNIKLQKLGVGVRLGRIADLVRARDQDELIVETPSHRGKASDVFLVSGKDLHASGARGRPRLNETIVLPDGRRACVVSSIHSSQRFKRMRKLAYQDFSILGSASVAAVIFSKLAGDILAEIARAAAEPAPNNAALTCMGITCACLLVVVVGIPNLALVAMGANRRRNPPPF